jgi:hypothetical protein
MVRYLIKPCKGDILEEKRNKKNLSTVGAAVLIFCAAPMGTQNILRWFITKLSPLRGCKPFHSKRCTGTGDSKNIAHLFS